MSLVLPTAKSSARSRWPAAGVLAAIHAGALCAMFWTEYDWLDWVLFLLIWGLLNCFWLVLLRRPALSAALSLTLVAAIIVLSQFKFSIVWMTLNFFDVLIIDPDTFAFLLSIYPDLRPILLVAGALTIPAIVLLWWLDPLRVSRGRAVVGAAACAVGIAGLSIPWPLEPSEAFHRNNHVSRFVRSGVLAAPDVLRSGWFEADATVSDRLKAGAADCRPATRPPHILLVLDEASFDITRVPGIRTPPRHGRHFQSFDGKTRSLVVESTGGPTWYAEYNVLTGLSSRSYGRLQYYVTRVAAGKVGRGLPQALRRCGYKTFTLYPAHNAFLSARRFQTGTGVQRLIDSAEMRMGDIEPDSFFYEQAARIIARERDKPLFLFVYTVANHFPWDFVYRGDRTPDWRAPGNGAEIDEYLRRQTMSARDYREFVVRLERDFPDEPFLIVRFGDHQPTFAARIVDPSADEATIGRRILASDPRYYTTYYAIDAVNYQPADVSSALDRLDASYLPMLIQEAAGLPLDPSFAEQKKIFERCQGLFYACAGGTEARRFNRLLIDAGLIKGLVSR
jgi:hypothetical protein